MRPVRLLAVVSLLLPTLAQAQTYYYPAAPVSGVSRASFVQSVMAQIGNPQDGTNCFVDVKTQSYAPSICGAKQQGIVTGDPSSRFRPDEPILFVEAAAVAIRATGTSVPFDNPWYRPYLTTLSDWNAFPASVSNVLYPINSSQAQEIINNVFSADRSGNHNDDDDDDNGGSDNDDDGDIHLTLKSSDTRADIGDTVTYTVTVRNDDNEDLHNLEIVATIDQDFDFVSATDGGDYDNDRIEWDDIDVDEDDSESVQFKLRPSGSADDGDKLSLRVRVEDAEVNLTLTVDEDEDDDDDDNDDNDDFRISISDSPATAEPGETVTYTIHLHNDDNEDMHVDVRAALDDDMEFVSASDDGDEDDDQVEWDNVFVEEDEDETITLKVRIDDDVDDGDSVRLEVRAEGEEDTETTEVEEEDDDDDDDDDINITISDSPDPAEVGEYVTYTIRVENNSNENKEIDVVATMDEGMSIYTSSDASQRNGMDITWRDLEISEGSTRTVNMKVRINTAADEGDTLTLKVRAGTIHEEETTRIDDLFLGYLPHP
jgi:uncharacterized repeat protein (TIGR01451 family)